MFIFQRKSTYYFRCRVPKHLVSVLGRQEVCISLRTKERRKAVELSGKLISFSLIDVHNLGLTLIQVLKDGSTIKVEADLSKPEEKAFVEKTLGDWQTQDGSAEDTLPFSHVARKYLGAKSSEGALEAVKAVQYTVKLFLEGIGDLPMRELTQGKLGEFKRLLELRTKRDGAKLAPKTLATHVKNIVAITTWASTNFDHVQALTSRGVAPKRHVRADEERDRFTQDDIKLLLHTGPLLPEQLWLIRLGALTGARISEIAQLNISTDFAVTTSGTAFMRICEGPGKRLKITSARRDIPLHPQLLDLGLLEWLDGQAKLGHTRPFESLWGVNQGSWGKYPSKWFGEFKKRTLAGRYTEEELKRKVFHSFRHTVTHHFKQAGVPPQLASAFLGHADHGITYSRYGKRLLADDLKPLLAHIPDLP